MKFSTVLAGSLILSLYISATSQAYDDPTQPSKVEPSLVQPSSTQPSIGKRQAGDNPPVKNGNPCIEEICINDEVKDLGHINWKKVEIRGAAQFSFSVMAIDDPKADQFTTNMPIKAIGDRQAIATFAKYFSTGKIDGIGLQAMSKIQGFCSKPIGDRNLIGEYTNKKGQKITVNFYVTPSADAKQQKFIVVRISKLIYSSKRLTYEQLDDLSDLAKQKYQDTYQDKPYLTRPTPNHYNMKIHFPSVSISNNGFGGTSLALRSQFKYGESIPGLHDLKVINPTTFMYFPGCGADKKMEI